MVLKSKFLNSTRLLACFIVAGTLQACGGGSGGSTTPPPPPPPPPPPTADTTAPSVSFSPVELTVESGQTGTSTLAATDNVGVTNGPTVNCTNGGSFSGSTFTAPTVTATTMSVCTATASDAAGNSGSATLTVRVTTPQEAPNASATSNKSFISEGQPFALDASGSSDPNADPLTYSWRQISGTAVTFADASTVIQNLNAPEISADEILEFEVTVNDGIDESAARISLTVEDLVPVETVSEASGFSSNSVLKELVGLTSAGADEYRVHWYGRGRFGQNKTDVSSQAFQGNGAKSGLQSDGALSEPFSVGVVTALRGTAVQSGNINYNIVNFVRSTGVSESTYVFTTAVGLLEDDEGSYGDELTNTRNVDESLMSFDTKPIGDNELLTVATFDLASQGRASLLGFTTAAYVTQPDGTSIETLITERERGVEKTGVSTAVFNDDTYAVVWAQSDSSSDDFDLKIQRASKAGILLGGKLTLNENTANAQLSTQAATMSDGNIFVTWSDYSGSLGDSDMGAIKGRIVRADGTFATPEFLINAEVMGNQIDPIVQPLSTNQAFVSWSIASGEGTSDIRGMIVNSDGSLGSNEFKLASSIQASDVEYKTAVVMPDDRVILGWYNDEPSGDGPTSYTMGFYPLGR